MEIVPYVKRWTETDKDGKPQPRSKIVYATFLPEELKIKGKIDCELLHRGIYEIPVYKMSLNLNGRFSPPDLAQWAIEPDDILWDRAYLSVRISDGLSF